MKRIMLSIMFLLILCVSVALAALTKTTTIIELDQWEEVLAGTLDVGAAGDISGSYDTILYLEIAYADVDAQDGVEVSIEVSYGDDDWTLLTKPFTTPVGTSETTTINGLEAAGQTVITLTDASKFNIRGLKWFMENGTDRDSESVRTKSAAGNNVTLCHDTQRQQADLSSVWDIVHERIVPIPASFAYVRVLINNVDANADIFYTTRISKVTGL